MTGEFLSAGELQTLTNCSSSRRSAQIEWLQREGIPAKLVDGRLLVSRIHMRSWLEGRPVVSSAAPNWSALSRA